MKITCRDCGAPIPAANINIQKMVALCTECNSVFALDQHTFARKAKRVIPKRPPRVKIHTPDADDHLALSYRMALGPGPKFGLFGSSVGSVVLTMLLFGMRADGAPGGAMVVVGLMLLFFLYIFAIIITTTTRISADDDTLEVTTGPLPFPISDDKTLNLNEIRHIYAKQTIEAFSGGIPANNVYAEMNDNRQIPIVTSLPYDYAHYFALLLDDHLNTSREIHELDEALDAESVPADEHLAAGLDDELSPPHQYTNAN